MSPFPGPDPELNPLKNFRPVSLPGAWPGGLETGAKKTGNLAVMAVKATTKEIKSRLPDQTSVS